MQPLTCVGGCFVFEGVDGGLGLGLVGGEAWLADTGPATQSRRRSAAGGCSACFVPVEPGSWDLSMEMPCFMDGWGILVELSMRSACFMDEGRVLVCLSMKVPCFMDERGFEEGCPQNRVVFEGAVPERMRFWAREWVVSGRDGAAGDCVAMVQESWETCSNGAVLLLK